MVSTPKIPFLSTLESNSNQKTHSVRNKSKMDRNCSSYISAKPHFYAQNRSKMKITSLKYHLKSYKHQNLQGIYIRNQILLSTFLRILIQRIVLVLSSTLKLEGLRLYKTWIWIHQRSYMRKTVLITLFRQFLSGYHSA